jgi:hypothetical protein
MSRKFSSLILAFACLITTGMKATVQNAKPVVFTTLSKVTVAKMQSDESDVTEVPGRVTLTVTAANFDDTITGTIVYTISDNTRQKIAKASGKDLSIIPTTFFKKDVISSFPKGTACPVMHVIIPPTVIEGAGIGLELERTVVEINESQGQMAQLICAWTRQINANRHRRGIIAAINRFIAGEQ